MYVLRFSFFLCVTASWLIDPQNRVMCTNAQLQSVFKEKNETEKKCCDLRGNSISIAIVIAHRESLKFQHSSQYTMSVPPAEKKKNNKMSIWKQRPRMRNEWWRKWNISLLCVCVRCACVYILAQDHPLRSHWIKFVIFHALRVTVHTQTAATLDRTHVSSCTTLSITFILFISIYRKQQLKQTIENWKTCSVPWTSNRKCALAHTANQMTVRTPTPPYCASRCIVARIFCNLKRPFMQPNGKQCNKERHELQTKSNISSFSISFCCRLAVSVMRIWYVLLK